MAFRIRTSIILLILSVCFLSCSAYSAEQRKFGADADYFAGLKMLKEGNKNGAIAKFKNCVKKGSFYCAKKSAIELCRNGTVQERNDAALFIVEKFSDSDSLLASVSQLYSAGEISKVIELTDKITFETEYNQIIKIRLEALKKRGDSSYDSQLFKWFICKPVSEFHFQFYKEYLKSFFDEKAFKELTPFQAVISARINTYRRNYIQVYKDAPVLFEYFEKNQLECTEQLASDIGKAFLYGNKNYPENAEFMKKQAQAFMGTSVEYYFWFYAARIYEKIPNYRTSTSNCYKNSIELAATELQKDNSMWYALNASLKNPADQLLFQIDDYSKKWSNPEYFEDFFETLSATLIAGGNFEIFGKLYKMLDGRASDETVAQYAYIFARLAECGYAKASAEEIQNAYRRALKSGSMIYYSILAAKKLGYDKLQLEQEIFAPKNAEKYHGTDFAACKLLEGYAVFGFPELIYENYMDLRDKGISAKTAFLLSEFLNKCASENNNYYVQSLRIASQAISVLEHPVAENEYRLFFPANFENLVNQAAEKYKLDSAIIFALIRSESFFDANVVSHAGAVGLTQLMTATGSDIARRLKVKDYDLKSADTNINFGTYYYADLLRRCNNSYLQAFFSYNAGITRVRRWLQSSLTQIGKMEKLPGDLFLEAIPYTETRGYGRKLISASIMYKLLYDSQADLWKFADSLL